MNKFTVMVLLAMVELLVAADSDVRVEGYLKKLDSSRT